ncbi:oxalurate catabolism protein HpxZ [Asticcacaulis sp. BYS171W]|uniref:Oxalurate catabolism protein HpxZ n=1 Tax=Asticcacaulis aquaticus TaxID=2984212 RepID=A0ABT5HXD7_9CAUL|nr:oxalurate catabolism protein HpxZ [Asticcacaulis aquaticus]MDC7684654.1 oxalurate catabolism protein HpxZ [Asticcacaulis aquaticus]
MQINDPILLKEMITAFYAYEAALMADNIPAMDALFRDAPETVRYGVGEVLYGIEEIRAFRKGRGGSPQRRLGRVEITVYGEAFATANAEFFREGSDKRGRQSQSWVKFADGWKVVSAHVSLEGAAS